MNEQVVERDTAKQVLATPEEGSHSHHFVPSLGARLITTAKGSHYQKPVSL